MIKEVTVFNNNFTTIEYELTLFAFKTSKGIFTLSGTNSDGTDEWRRVGSCDFHTWKRKDVYLWFLSGKIEPIKEATSICWMDT